MQFSTTTGKLTFADGFTAQGYAGFGQGKLNPAVESIHDVGPIPRGHYTVTLIMVRGFAADYEGKKAPVFRLTPEAGTNTFGRAGFLIHGDSYSAPGAASHGCIVVSRDVRERIQRSRETILEVI